MRIGIDGHVLGKNIGGVERYVEKLVELVPDLCPQHEFIVFITRQARPRYAAETRANVTFVSLPVADPMLQRSVVLPWAVRRHRIDVLQVQRIAPWGCGDCRIALTVHDIIPLKSPDGYTGLRNRLVRLLTPASIRRADMILCPTRTICDDVAAWFPGTAARSRAFYLGTDPAIFRRGEPGVDAAILQRHGITGPFLFSPGAIEPRKNLQVVIRALALLEPDSRPLLLLSGSIRAPAYFREIQSLAGELGVADSIRHLGFLPDEDLVALYGHARLCVAASFEEGFNLLPLEAMTCGTPVACSDIPVHRELYEQGAWLFPADQPDRLARIISRLLTDQHARAATTAGARACVTNLSWHAMAQRMSGFFNELQPLNGVQVNAESPCIS